MTADFTSRFLCEFMQTLLSEPVKGAFAMIELTFEDIILKAFGCKKRLKEVSDLITITSC